jgi:hypothetical protein
MKRKKKKHKRRIIQLIIEEVSLLSKLNENDGAKATSLENKGRKKRKDKVCKM